MRIVSVEYYAVMTKDDGFFPTRKFFAGGEKWVGEKCKFIEESIKLKISR